MRYFEFFDWKVDPLPFGGEVRAVPRIDLRLRESSRIGVNRVIFANEKLVKLRLLRILNSLV